MTYESPPSLPLFGKPKAYPDNSLQLPAINKPLVFCHLQARHQIVQIVSVVAVRGNGEERSVCLIPRHAAAHGQQVSQGDIGLHPFRIGRQVARYGIVQTINLPFVEGHTRQQSHDGLCGRIEVRGQRVVPPVTVTLKKDAVTMNDEKRHGATSSVLKIFSSILYFIRTFSLHPSPAHSGQLAEKTTASKQTLEIFSKSLSHVFLCRFFSTFLSYTFLNTGYKIVNISI